MTAATNLSREGAAFDDAVSVGESGGDYTILFGGGHFDDSTPSLPGHFGFPDWPGKLGPEGISHAAGRYQFEPATWLDTATRLFPQGSTPDFRNPADQDWGAWLLAQSDYKRRTNGGNLADALKVGGLTAGVATALKSTWTSLDPATFPTRYAAALAALAPAPPAPVPAPAPPAPSPPVSPYQAVLADLTARRDKLDAAIEAIKAIME